MLLSRFFVPSLALLLQILPSQVLADQILKTSGFSTCLANSPITVKNVDIEYNNDNKVSRKYMDIAFTSAGYFFLASRT